MYRGAKNERKIAKLDDCIDEKNGLKLHVRQSLAERLIFSSTTNSCKITRNPPKATYLICNLGLLITDRPHKKNGDHIRVFRTISIEIDYDVISGDKGHAECALIAFLSEKTNLNMLLTKFKQLHHIEEGDHKVYSMYTVPLICAYLVHCFQYKLRTLLLTCFAVNGLKTLTQYPKQLPVIIRYSSDIDNQRTDMDRRGFPKTCENNIEVQQYCANRDIKCFGSNLLIHGDESWHGVWDDLK